MVHSDYLTVEGIRTHFLEAGEGPVLVLLHSGEYGGAAEISWEFNIAPLAEHFHVLAPDWLGFGRTDKLFDFADRRGRLFGHMRAFLAAKGVNDAHFIGNSMGGTNLAQIAAMDDPIFPLRSVVLASGGGRTIDSAARRTLLAYDGTDLAMRDLVAAMLHDPKWANDNAYIARRQALALIPGAYECASAPRLRLPGGDDSSPFGAPDATPYENIRVPALVIAGADDPLREPGYANDLAARIPNAELAVIDGCGHCPNIEHADLFNDTVIRFLQKNSD